MEDRPVQEGYHRPARKKKRAGLPAFFLAVIVLALLAAALLRIWLGNMVLVIVSLAVMAVLVWMG